MYEAIRILLFALVAAASPTALLATLAVLSSERKRANGIMFTAGFLISQTIVLVIVYLLGLTANHMARPTASGYLELVVGAGVLVICLTRPRFLEPQTSREPSKTKALLERLRGVQPGVSFGIGALLGVGAKRLLLTVIAAGALALSALPGVVTFWLGLAYIAVATIIVWLPVLYSVMLGKHTDGSVTKMADYTETLGRRHASVVGIVVGALLMVDALVRLLG